MKILILSDIHDNIWNLKKLIKQVDSKVEEIIFCGDMVAPSTVAILSSLELPTYCVLGNNDEDQIGMYKKGGDHFTWFHVGQLYGEVELGNRKIAFCHYPKLGELLAKTGNYDAVFYGHNHTVKEEKIDSTLLVNPGVVGGFRGSEEVDATYAIYDTEINKIKILKI